MSLTKFALITFLIGLLALFIISSNLEPKLIKISEINSQMIDKYVKIQGDIVKTKIYDQFSIITLNDSIESIQVLVNQNLNLSGNIEVIGKIKEYKGTREIEATNIKKI